MTVLAVMAVLAAVAVPSAAGVRRAVGGHAGAQRLALLLRSAQATAQACGQAVHIRVGKSGDYTMESPSSLENGSLGVAVSSNFPDGSLDFSPSGWPCLAGTETPRAGSFSFGTSPGLTVVVQLGGCIRCR